MKSTLFLGLTSLLAGARATSYHVNVGPGLSFSPSTISGASEGDIVQFRFGAGHDVVSGNFDSPCQPNGNIYSGEPNDGDIFSVVLNSTDPIWIYCSVPQHCQNGMAMVINPESGKSIDDYKSAAANAGSSSAPDSVIGGVFGDVTAASASSSASSSASAAASSTRASASSAASSASGTRSSTSASASSTSASSASTFGAGLSSLISVAAIMVAALL